MRIGKFIVVHHSLLFAVISGLAALAGFAIARVRQDYGRERDIRHLQNKYKDLSKNMDFLVKDSEEELRATKQHFEKRMDSIETSLATIRGMNEVLLRQNYFHHRPVSLDVDLKPDSKDSAV